MKEKGIKILVSIFLFASILMPFSVSADTITSANIIGVNKVLLDSTYIESVTRTNTTYNRFTFTYEYEILLDDYYLGYINGSIQQSYRDYDTSLSNPTIENRSLTKPNTSYYVNGNSFKTSLSITAWCYVISGSSQVDPTNIYNPVFSLNTSNIVKYQDIDSIDTVINLLTDIHNDLYIDILSELQSIVINTNLSNTYLETISKMRQYDVYSESYLLYFYMLNLHSDKIYGNNYYLNYPVFKFNANESYFKWNYFERNTTYKFIGYFTINPSSQYMTYDTNSFRMSNVKYLGGGPISNVSLYLYSFDITNITNSTQVLDFKFTSSYYICPIAFIDINNIQYVTTDFALRFGLSNELLDNLGIIAQGTQQSQQAGSDLEDATSDMQSDFNSYYSIENSANSDFNSALNGINFNDQIAGNQSFLDSASFVKTVFSSMMQIPILSTFVIILCIILMARIFL